MQPPWKWFDLTNVKEEWDERERGIDHLKRRSLEGAGLAMNGNGLALDHRHPEAGARLLMRRRRDQQTI